MIAVAPSRPDERSRRRVVLYSHDTQGLGHVRRNLAIAGALAASGTATDILLLAGAGEAGRFPLPPATELLTLPALHKFADGSYGPRSLSGTLGDLIRLRGRTIAAALEAYAPDALVVDKVALGVGGELAQTLAALRGRGRTRVVIGLRDVLDAPATVHEEWERDGTIAALRRSYDAIWVYGDPRVYDPVREYRLPVDIAAKVRYTGYLGEPDRVRAARAPADLPSRFVLCCVGGGQDGYPLAEAFLRAELPSGLAGLVVTGPFMPASQRAALCKLATDRPAQQVVEFVEGYEPLLRAADAVVSMGGYNATCELLSTTTPALIVPRVRPRLEQLIRAERLAARGLVDLLHPDDVAPDALSRWLRAIDQRPARAGRVALDGLDRLPVLLDDLLAPETMRRAAL